MPSILKSGAVCSASTNVPLDVKIAKNRAIAKISLSFIPLSTNKTVRGVFKSITDFYESALDIEVARTQKHKSRI